MPAFTLRGGATSGFLGFASCGLSLIGTGSTLFGSAEIDLNFVPRDFSVVRAAEGPQILISWTDPIEETASPFEYQLRRAPYWYPKNLEDGDLVSSGTSSGDRVISDRDVIADQVYHYTLFVNDPTAE